MDDGDDVREDILQGMAENFWGLQWANHAEEHGCYDLSGCEITQHMPPIPDEVHTFCREVAAEIEAASGATLEELYARAVAADEAMGTEAPDNRSGPERFGSCLAYEYVGAGVSWEDDHEPVPGLVVPGGDDYQVRILADDTCDAEEHATPRELAKMHPRVTNWCGHYVKSGRDKCQECSAALHWRGKREVRAADGPEARAFLRKLETTRSPTAKRKEDHAYVREQPGPALRGLYVSGRWGREGSKRWRKAERRLWRLLRTAPEK